MNAGEVGRQPEETVFSGNEPCVRQHLCQQLLLLLAWHRAEGLQVHLLGRGLLALALTALLLGLAGALFSWPRLHRHQAGGCEWRPPACRAQGYVQMQETEVLHVQLRSWCQASVQVRLAQLAACAVTQNAHWRPIEVTDQPQCCSPGCEACHDVPPAILNCAADTCGHAGDCSRSRGGCCSDRGRQLPAHVIPDAILVHHGRRSVCSKRCNGLSTLLTWCPKAR